MSSDSAVPDARDPALDAVIAAIDAANAGDPSSIEHAGEPLPLALAEGRVAFDWVHRLRPDAPAPLLIAARGHHIRRWETPRSSYPTGREGYLAWRSHLYEVHAAHLETLMRDAGYGDADVEAMRQIVGKRGIKTNPDVQSYEDAVALAFLELQFAPFAERTARSAVVRALRRTWRKMSDEGRAAALTLQLPPELFALVQEAIASPAEGRSS